ncbi:MAG: DEAD/DEAH box helicase [Anaerolineales bacterium]
MVKIWGYRLNASSPQGRNLTNSTIPSGIRDNYRRGKVGDFLKEKIQKAANLSIVSAYFTIYAYEALKGNLEQIEHLRFLFGEPRFIRSLDPEKIDKKAYDLEDGLLRLSNRLEQRRVARECAAWLEQKAEIRSVKHPGFLHGKLYHITQANGIEDALLGSSNFTVNGLGLNKGGARNVELNLVVEDRRDLRALKTWFDELWENRDLVEDVRAEVLAYLAQLYQDNAPEFIYFKTLYHIFEEFLNEEARSGLSDIQRQVVDTEIWQALFEFQKDGVKGAINKILAHNGCILADSVGLGKTFEALAIIKYFELKNERVLVLCPKKLRENWTVYQAQNNSELNPFLRDRFSYTVLSHTDLSRAGGRSGDVDLANINWGNYDLVVIDESHNFRNNTPGKQDENGNTRKSRYERLMDEIIKSGVKTKVLLLSATPVNNNLRDLRNQIALMSGGQDGAFLTSLNIASLTESLAAAQRSFTEWAKKDKERNTKELLEKLSPAFFRLLDAVTIARSRKHIEKYYAESVTRLGGFPKRSKPLSLAPEIDLRGEFMSYDRLNVEIERYQLSLFNPSRYVKAEFRAQYENERVAGFSQAQRENYLIGMMKVNFLKRLESSVHSFELTLTRTIQKIDGLRARIERFQQFQEQNPALNWNDLQVEDLDDDEVREAFEVSKARFKMSHLDLEQWLKDLKEDRQQLYILQVLAAQVSRERDAKLAELKKLIAAKVRQPSRNKNGQPNRKVLVFTAFADTAAYLYDSLKDWARAELGIHLALVSGGAVENKSSFGKNDFNQILTNFSPVSKKRDKMRSMPQQGEIDLLIATDCISEGQNLQDCDYLINYDIHWNPVRVIQRFGRIDRIGSLSETVQLVNFWPTQDLDKYISLKTRVEARMALVDIAATQEDNLLNPEEIEDLVTDDLKYRDRQLRRLKDEVLDLEDFNESVALTDFTLDDFRAELSRYIEANRELLQNAPLGLYAIVPPDPAHPLIRPGVLFCLRQKGTGAATETVNPLQPYFLVYIQNDGVVRLGFTHPKQILDIYQTLCAGKSSPYEDLCRLFNEQTQNGAEMTFYNGLLQKALASIESAFRKRSLGSLLSARGAALLPENQQVSEKSDFELITWLIIQ